MEIGFETVTLSWPLPHMSEFQETAGRTQMLWSKVLEQVSATFYVIQRVKPLGFAGHVISVMTTLPSCCHSSHEKHGSECVGLCSKWDLLTNQTGFYCQATAALSLSWRTNSILGEDPYVEENMFPAKWISCSPPDVGHARRESWSFAFSESRMNIMSYETSRETPDCLRQPTHVSLLLDGFYRVEGNANQCHFFQSFLFSAWMTMIWQMG